MTDAERAEAASDDAAEDEGAGQDAGHSADGTQDGAAHRAIESDVVSDSAPVSGEAEDADPESLGEYAEDVQDLRDLAALDSAPREGGEAMYSGASGNAGVEAATPDNAARDELIRIDGVGPALQERLYSFGYRRWQDLAELDDDAIEKLTVQLELDDEVREQDWCGQARRLMEEQT